MACDGSVWPSDVAKFSSSEWEWGCDDLDFEMLYKNVLLWKVAMQIVLRQELMGGSIRLSSQRKLSCRFRLLLSIYTNSSCWNKRIKFEMIITYRISWNNYIRYSICDYHFKFSINFVQLSYYAIQKLITQMWLYDISLQSIVAFLFVTTTSWDIRYWTPYTYMLKLDVYEQI